LWNVLKGEMSIVGPRPMNEEEIAAAPEYGSRRLLATPGITGLWQVSGRKETTWEQRFELDLRYVINWRLSLDVAIIFKTFKVILTGNQGSI
jgi:lipopolysaccharide/colanic/teichoic acid biosynthesis glycosyltransferase